MSPKPILRLELAFKKLTITDAIVLLSEEQLRGATHVSGMRVRWEESPHDTARVVAGGGPQDQNPT